MKDGARAGRSGARGGVSSRLMPALALAGVAASGLWAPALAQEAAPSSAAAQTCPDAFADIYFMPDADKYPDGLPPGMTEGLPRRHLRLPRAFLEIRLIPGQQGIYPNRLCQRSAFAAAEAIYYGASELAQRLGVTYDVPSPYPTADQLRMTGGSGVARPDDTGDREGVARNGTWVTNPAHGPRSLTAFFCLPPLPSQPMLRDPCYAVVDESRMIYATGGFRFSAHPAVFAMFLEGAPSFRRRRTTEDLDRYFAILRALAAAVIVNDATPIK